MNTLYLVLSLIAGITITHPTITQQDNLAPSVQYEHTSFAVRGVASTNTIITPKPKPEPPKQPVAQSSQKPMIPSSVQNQGSCFDYVQKYSTQYGVDAGLMTRIIQAESGGNPKAKNAYSTASGCAQFIQSTWAGTLRQMGREWITPFDAETNVEAMAFKIANGGLSAWNASRSKWAQ